MSTCHEGSDGTEWRHVAVALRWLLAGLVRWGCVWAGAYGIEVWDEHDIRTEAARGLAEIEVYLDRHDHGV